MQLQQAYRSEAWDGTLGVPEFGRLLEKLGLDQRSAGPLFGCFDRDGDGRLDYKEVERGVRVEGRRG